jgi:hypothetical protein
MIAADDEENTVTCRAIAKQHFCKQATVQQPLIGNSSVETSFPRKMRELTENGREIAGS